MVKSGTYILCPNCDGEVTGDSDFCPHCGELFDRGQGVPCSFHPRHDATGVCIICRKTLCADSGLRRRGRWLCKDHKKVRVEQDWALVFESPDINEAELVKSALESFGYRVVAQNFGPNTAVWDGGGDSYMSRHSLNRLARVFVPIPDYQKAILELHEWKSQTTTS